MDGPFPAIDPNALGDEVSVSVDTLLVPFLLGAIEELRNPANWHGDEEDIRGTVEALDSLLAQLAGL